MQLFSTWMLIFYHWTSAILRGESSVKDFLRGEGVICNEAEGLVADHAFAASLRIVQISHGHGFLL